MIRAAASHRYRAAILSLFVLITSIFVTQRSLADTGEKRPVIHQLRIYEIFDANKQAFHDRFRDHAARIMARYDFNIVAMWESRTDAGPEFVYLLEWPDKETMTDRWARFMADQEWADIKKQTGAVHGRLVGGIEDRTLLPTEYSPTKAFQGPSGVRSPTATREADE